MLTSILCIVVLGATSAPTATATWSIVVTDLATGEVGISSATCVANIDLRAVLATVVPGVGAAACQASGDFDGMRRPILRQSFLSGLSPTQILDQVSSVAGHNSRQYGIVTTESAHTPVVFTGGAASDWKGGREGSVGNIRFALQGNILAGACVVDAIYQGVVDGILQGFDIPELLMIALETGHRLGGDGRCSCSAFSPESCGCPVPNFAKSSHIAFMIAARANDTDSNQCGANGCAEGDYYLDLNVPNLPANGPEPIAIMRQLFDDWRQENPLAKTKSITVG